MEGYPRCLLCASVMEAQDITAWLHKSGPEFRSLWDHLVVPHFRHRQRIAPGTAKCCLLPVLDIMATNHDPDAFGEL